MQRVPETSLLRSEPVIVTAGTAALAQALTDQAVPVVEVDWRPPVPGTEAALAKVLADPRREAANALALERMTATRPQVVTVAPAAELLGLDPGTFLHAGPPITWDRTSGPMRGALIGAALFEGLAATPEEAETRFASGEYTLEPCHHRGAVGPMAGVVSPSMWMWVVEDEGRRAVCSLNEGLGKVLRMGAFGPEVIDRLQWMSKVLGPALRDAIEDFGGLDARAHMAQALQMGDELHNRNRAATSLLTRVLGSSIAKGPHAAEIFAFIDTNDHFFLNIGMASAKLSCDAARDIPGSSIVTAMARNGTDFGIQVSGCGARWFTGPAGVPDGLYMGDYGPEDANPDIGDSTIMETAGLGGFAMAAAPAIVRFIGGTVDQAIPATMSMYEITSGEHPSYALPPLEFRGSPVGIDVALIARTGILPVVNTGIAGKVAGTGQVGAGLVRPPANVFTDALAALAS